MTTKFTVESLVAEDGERFLVMLEDGLPAWYQNLYYSTERRINTYAANTVLREAYNIQMLHSWAHEVGVCLESRFAKGQYFNVAEMDSLVAYCLVRRSKKPKVSNVVKYGQQKKRLSQDSCVEASTANLRIKQIAYYIDWWTLEANMSLATEERRIREKERWEMLRKLKKRAPRPSRDNVSNFSKTLPPEVMDVIFKTVDPNSERNPWKHRVVRVRNHLILMMFATLGIRKGELLGLKLSDLNLPESSLYILKNPDDSTDPRIREPNAKTFSRELKVTGNLSRHLQDCMAHRRKIKGAGKHSFLFISLFGPSKGQPLSIAAVNKIISDLKGAHPEVIHNISAHSFRHTYFTGYARHLKSSGKTPVEIKQRLDETGGWMGTHMTSAHYTQQFIIEQAHESQVEYQEGLGFLAGEKD
tara:strand:- start:2203 stop:3447 length:1245 start_codon:yes stop_codon:yes gene_type:complete